MTNSLRWVFVLLALFGNFNAWAISTAKPKLVVVLVFDQFRADYLTRFENRFLPPQKSKTEVGGFRFLMETGAYFPFAEYDLLQSMTGPGHATILTGALPYQTGIPTNWWFDTKTGKKSYCVADGESVSPKNLETSTLGDELKNSGYPSTVVSLSLKDRAAILMGGHRADFVMWYDPKTPAWASSSYYLPTGKLPPWLVEFNEKKIQARKDEVYTWSINKEGRSELSAPDAGNFLATAPSKNIGATFPHVVTFGTRESFATPLGTDLIVEAAEKLMDVYKLGQGKATDLFAVSFSNHDYMGHAFGPNSREMEEMTVAEDRALSRLLNSILKKVPGGLDNVVFVLTADHGAPSSPEWLKEHKMPAGRISEEDLVKKANDLCEKKWGKLAGSYVLWAYDLNFYLNREGIAKKGLSLTEVEKEVKGLLANENGVAHVFTEQDVADRKLPPENFERRILKTYYSKRSGEVTIIPKPNYMPVGDNIEHLTAYSYDRMVPLILRGKAFKAGRYATHAAVIDLAPTLSWVLGVVPPASSEGRVLSEAIR